MVKLDGLIGLMGNEMGPLRLLVLQPTPFCNLDCKYCYLGNRSDPSKMSISTVRQSLDVVTSSGLLGDELTIIWHSGEPLVLGTEYYRKCFEVIQDVCRTNTKIKLCFQTNGVLIDNDWCQLFKEYNVQVGVSIDGPRYIHDQYRVNRSGAGTHVDVERGLDYLREYEIPLRTISVLTSTSLLYVDELFFYFHELGVEECGFNIEEIEGVNKRSTIIESGNVEERVYHFFKRFDYLNKIHSGGIRIRELENVKNSILASKSNGIASEWCRTMESKELAILTIDVDGNYSTFSPELHGIVLPGIGRYVFGNVFDNPLEAISNNTNYRIVKEEVSSGIEQCRTQCEYHKLCGYGSPSNKYFENGSMNSSFTKYCALHKQVPIEVVLDTD